MIIAVDYDDTLEINKSINEVLVNRLKAWQRKGHIIILWTCREGDRLKEAVLNLKSAGFVPNIINDNAPHIIAQFGHNPRKVFADIYIDDKNVK